MNAQVANMLKNHPGEYSNDLEVSISNTTRVIRSQAVVYALMSPSFLPACEVSWK